MAVRPDLTRTNLADARPARDDTALYLTEALSDLNDGAGFLDRLSPSEIKTVRRATTTRSYRPGETIFLQGDRHNGIFLIEAGQVRTYYAGPSGREITLAYWTPGHFVGGPEVFGGGLHIWSADAPGICRLSFLPGHAIRQLALSIPAFAICLIEGLVAKGKCYSALIHMLGTRSATERLAQLLLILAELHDREGSGHIVVNRRITHEKLAGIVGSMPDARDISTSPQATDHGPPACACSTRCGTVAHRSKRGLQPEFGKIDASQKASAVARKPSVHGPAMRRPKPYSTNANIDSRISSLAVWLRPPTPFLVIHSGRLPCSRALSLWQALLSPSYSSAL